VGRRACGRLLSIARAVRLLPLVALVACEREAEPAPPPPRIKQEFHLNGYEKGFGYSQAIAIDKTIYVSGTMAVDASGRLVAPNDMAGQIRAVYDNIRRTLEANGAGFENVVKENIYTTDMDAFLKAADERFDYYGKEHLPAVSWVEVRRLADPGFLIMIDVVVELP
jgi:2-iminobutanoate/2-iminopropanoate deaminase